MSDTFPLLQLNYDLRDDKYLDFVAELRDKARDKDKSSHGRPILPLEGDADPPYVDVYLQEGGLYKGLAKVRRYDLRLIDYQDPSGNLLNVDEFQLYDDNSRLVDFGIQGLLIGLPTFIEAVNSLVNFYKKLHYSDKYILVPCDSKNQDNFKLRTSIFVLCLVLCEAAKLDLLSCMLDNAFKSEFEVPSTSWLLEHINDWGFFSKQLLLESELHDDDACCDFFLPYEKNNWHDGRRVIGVTCQDVAQFLGIIRAVSPSPDPMMEKHLSGTCLMEIYSVSVYLNDRRSGSVYGSIKIVNDYDTSTFHWPDSTEDTYGTISIYKRDSNECESIESHGTLSLQDPDDFFIAKNAVLIWLDLKGGEDNMEISKGKFWWGSITPYELYDYRLSAMVKGKNGYAVVYYSVFSEAIQAVVEASLLTKEGYPYASEDVCVCGRLSARYGDLAYAADFHEKYYVTTLYDKLASKDLSCTLECKKEKVQEPIKLSRSRVSVPVDDSLVIKAELKSCDGKPIVTGSMEWFPKQLGEFEDTMVGLLGDSHLLRVKVKWIDVV